MWIHLIPFEFTFRGLLVSHAILLGAACIDINKIISVPLKSGPVKY